MTWSEIYSESHPARVPALPWFAEGWRAALDARAKAEVESRNGASVDPHAAGVAAYIAARDAHRTKHQTAVLAEWGGISGTPNPARGHSWADDAIGVCGDGACDCGEVVRVSDDRMRGGYRFTKSATRTPAPLG